MRIATDSPTRHSTMSPVPSVANVVAQIFIHSPAGGKTYPYVSAPRKAVESGLGELGFEVQSIRTGVKDALDSPMVSSDRSGKELRALTAKG